MDLETNDGVAHAQDIIKMTEQGIPIISLLQKMLIELEGMPISVKAVGKRIRKGKISTDLVNNTIYIYNHPRKNDRKNLLP